MSRAGRRLRRVAAHLHTRLLLSHLLVVVAGMVVLFVTARLLAPELFHQHMAERRGATAGPGPRIIGPMLMAEEVDQAFAQALNQGLLLAGGAALLIAAGASALIARQIARPINRMAAATNRIAEGHYTERVPVFGTNELQSLAESFNTMAAALEHTEQRRLDLIGDVAHELRTPLATLQGYLEGLQDGVVPASVDTWSTLSGETARLSRLVADLQELSRAETHQVALSLEAVAPDDAIRLAANPLAADFAAKGLTLAIAPDPSVPPVRADRDRLTQVLTNLLSNALHYTPAPGTVEVHAARNGGAVRFSVCDTGIGVPAGQLPFLFDRFYRVDKSRSRALGGSGIGLTIARSLVEAMDGRIAAESPGPGQGTTVWFELPVAP